MSIVFKEAQKFSQWWLWLLLLAIGVLPITGLYKQLYLQETFGNTPMSSLSLSMFGFFVFLLIALFWIMKLKTQINQHGIGMHFFPFVKKQVHWDQIKSAAVVNYGFVGGWGIRLFTSYGTVYNIKGNMGIAIVLTSGKKFLIGTQNPKELTAALEKLAPTTVTNS